MGTVSRLPLPVDDGRPAVRPGVSQPLRLTMTGFLSFVCGATIGIKFDIVGEFYLVEFLLALVAMQCVLTRGIGKDFVAPLFFGFLFTGMVTFCGYLLSDVLAANEPWQYLKGWGRVALLILDCAMLMILVAQERYSLWWLAFGIGTGGILALVAQGVPLTQWKLGYGEYAAMLVLCLSALVPVLLGETVLGLFGVTCLFLDYRSLGAACIVIAVVTVYRKFGGGRRHQLRKWLGLAFASAAIAVVLAMVVSLTDETYGERREISNIGRYAAMVVGWQAISESPFLGYGSWAADERFTQMMQSEARQTEAKLNRRIDVGHSMLPHSQILQAWIEGGLLGLVFFLFYAWQIMVAMRWFLFDSVADAMLPVCLFALIFGAWDLLASPFLGYTRMHIAMAVATCAIAAAAKFSGLRRVQAAPMRTAGTRAT